ncbi:hypothetical protein LZ318_08325 [Saccharopolyspora indica]|uniref:hypothetical protein n=1 Tax=Saccharopolyspora indica TaxID=1229659 RepID=UPI0022EA1664|nr:hypothetical protein [Saccharopolyspora indica]MDA3649641.1 hypothetical protein [Saccharopolyspora indica]
MTGDVRLEADELLQARGLLALASDVGETFVGGSYHSDLMIWRDLDIYIRAPELSVAEYFEFGGRVAQLVDARSASFRDNWAGAVPDLPHGLYFGIKQGDPRRGAWKLDLWALDDADFERTRATARAFTARLTPESRAAILDIKAAYWVDPRYRDTVTSTMIYEAVLTAGVNTPEEFRRWLG